MRKQAQNATECLGLVEITTKHLSHDYSKFPKANNMNMNEMTCSIYSCKVSSWFVHFDKLSFFIISKYILHSPYTYIICTKDLHLAFVLT